jgi:hypothetical protein
MLGVDVILIVTEVFVCGFDDGMVLVECEDAIVMLLLSMIDNEEIGIAAGA